MSRKSTSSIVAKAGASADLLDPEKLTRLKRSAKRTSPQLLATIERYLTATGIAVSAFGTKAMNDAGFVQGLRAGRQCKPETAAKVISHIKRCPLLQAARMVQARPAAGRIGEGARA